MDTIIVVLIVAAATLFIGRRVWRSVQSARAKHAACASCGCSDEQDPLSV